MPGPTRDESRHTAPTRTRVLVVHGNAETRHALASTLTTEGITVDEAVSARDAAAIVRYARPDVVVYDLAWGAGVRRLDALASQVEETHACTPAVVLLTPAWARAERGITLRGRVSPTQLASAVRRASRERRP